MTDSISPRAHQLHAGDAQGRYLAHIPRPRPVRETPPHCATCPRYHTAPDVLQTGECRLYPAGTTGTPGNLALRYPSVAATDYCGAHPDTASLG